MKEQLKIIDFLMMARGLIPIATLNEALNADVNGRKSKIVEKAVEPPKSLTVQMEVEAFLKKGKAIEEPMNVPTNEENLQRAIKEKCEFLQPKTRKLMLFSTGKQDLSPPEITQRESLKEDLKTIADMFFNNRGQLKVELPAAEEPEGEIED